MIPRKTSKPLVFIRDVKEKKNADKVFFKKVEKTVYETKEEKHNPAETKDFSNIPISKLKAAIGEYSVAELTELLKDERVSAVRLAREELKRREG
jgi:hypothetical protein